MRRFKSFFLPLLIILFLLSHISFAQKVTKPKIAVLPFYPLGVEPVAAQSSESILRLELQKLDAFELIPESTISDAVGERYCTDFSCALTLGKQLAADEVLTCKMVALGEKIIVQYMLLDVAAEKVLLLDQTTSVSVEDMDSVVKRIALAVYRGEPIKKTAEVGNITEQETITPRRRKARNFAGFLFGYLYPLNGYDDTDRSFTMQFRTGAEMNNYAVGVQLAARKGFAMNVFASYLLTKTDFCPYVGSGFGFHWVSHSHIYEYGYHPEYGYSYEEKKMKGDGFELTTNIGFIAFRTYVFKLVADFSFSYTLNDYHDSAFTFTLGFMH